MITKVTSFFQEQKISCLSVICNHTIPNIWEITCFYLIQFDGTYIQCQPSFIIIFFFMICLEQKISAVASWFCFVCLFSLLFRVHILAIISSVIGSSRKGVCDIQMATSHPSHVLYLDATKFYCQVYFLIFTFFQRLLPENQGETTIKDCIKSTSGYHMQLKNTDA